MARPAKTIDYRDLTIDVLREKSASLLLGIAVFAALLISGTYLFSKYTLVWNNHPRQVAKKETKGATAPKFPTTYVTQEGDSLASVSQKMYGSDAYVQEIMQANGLYAADNLEVGKKLTIPAITPQANQGQIGEGLMTNKVSYTGDTYTVQAGESLADVAIKVYGDVNAWIKIAQANNITNPNFIVEGTVLKIPKE